MQDGTGNRTRLEWKSLKPEEVEVKVPLQEMAPGELTLLVKEYGREREQPVQLHAYTEASHLETFTLHAGDSQGTLTGSRLDEVDALKVNGLEFSPGELVTADGHDRLSMITHPVPSATQLKQGEAARGRVALKDGREFEVRISVEAPRPSARVIDKSALPLGARTGIDIRLSGAEELPQDAQVTFSLRAQAPGTFTRTEKIEVAIEDGTSTVLDASNGGVTFQNAKVVVATFAPAKSLGPSAFGPLRFRIITGATAGDWQPLATLVRLPTLKSLECPDPADAPCTLTGANLFLLDSVAGNAQFSQPVRVPDGFSGRAIQVPRPASSQIYVKLRDDPAVISVAVVDPHPGRTAGETGGG
jgi:hypothetical protein